MTTTGPNPGPNPDPTLTFGTAPPTSQASSTSYECGPDDGIEDGCLAHTGPTVPFYVYAAIGVGLSATGIYLVRKGME